MAEKIEATLTHDKVWKQFHAVGNEMWITEFGNRIIPKLEYIVKGLASDKLYQFYIRFDPADNYRYVFCKNKQWIGSEKWKKDGEPQMMCHPDGVQTGEEWMSTSVAFDRLKIVSDNQRTDSNNVFLHSSHKYIPVLIIFETQSRDPNGHSNSRPVAFIKMAHTEFICVTIYRNPAFKAVNDSIDRKAKYYSSGGKAQPKRNRKRSRNATSTTSMVPPAPIAPLMAPMPPFPPLMPNFFPPPTPFMPAGFNPFLTLLFLGNQPFPPLLPFTTPTIPFPVFPTPPSTVCETEHQEEKEEDNEEEDENVEIDIVN